MAEYRPYGLANAGNHSSLIVGGSTRMWEQSRSDGPSHSSPAGAYPRLQENEAPALSRERRAFPPPVA